MFAIFLIKKLWKLEENDKNKKLSKPWGLNFVGTSSSSCEELLSKAKSGLIFNWGRGLMVLVEAFLGRYFERSSFFWLEIKYFKDF